MSMTSMFTNFLRWPIIPRILSIIFLVILLFGTLVHFIEPDNFPTLFDGIWWAIVTTSTIGFGDFVPTSITGRIVAIFLILIGTGFVTTYFVTLSSVAVTNQNAYIEGKTSFKGTGHIVIIGWNERVKKTISQLNVISPQRTIVLVDESLEINPVQSSNIHFIKGNQNDDDTLTKAKIQDAEMILITADQSKDEILADMNSVLTLVAVNGLNPNIYSIIEILTTKHVENAKRAGADEIIQTNTLSSYVMINSIISHGMTNGLLTMLDQVKGSKLKYIKADDHDHIVGKSFGDCSNELLKEKILLIGVKRGPNTTINPGNSYTINQHDELFVIIN